MRHFFPLLVCLLCCELSMAQKRQETERVNIDSLSFSYDIRHMTILLNDTVVHYSVIFDTKTHLWKQGFVCIGEALSSPEAVKYYGERYCKGILIYRREEDLKNGK
ncbi:MAG: hypothetical protein K2P55_12070 [Bacteroides acidifaciens]|uniref:hypothetical protein n=1 Tax=Bacteroides acidifaciens TaxID=85831 RepID=UPI0023C3BE88|nr:hypothetical protein [Bacteroides acidifaciens]MDE6822399.1 hypothetical protein [Bacteroides acidifaciens]MDE6987625.1 hypothetical protein [Bacteroides acidifaciens]